MTTLTLLELVGQTGHGPYGPMGGHGAGTAPWSSTWVGAVVVSVLVLVLVATLVVTLFAVATRTAGGRDDDAVAVLRRRYARGDLDDEAFEQRRARLAKRRG